MIKVFFFLSIFFFILVFSHSNLHIQKANNNMRYIGQVYTPIVANVNQKKINTHRVVNCLSQLVYLPKARHNHIPRVLLHFRTCPLRLGWLALSCSSNSNPNPSLKGGSGVRPEKKYNRFGPNTKQTKQGKASPTSQCLRLANFASCLSIRNWNKTQ